MATGLANADGETRIAPYRADRPISRLATQRVINDVYAGLGLPAPQIIWCASPRQVMVLPAMLDLWQRLVAHKLRHNPARAAREEIAAQLTLSFAQEPWRSCWLHLTSHCSDEVVQKLDEILCDFDEQYIMQIGFPIDVDVLGKLQINRFRGVPLINEQVRMERNIGPGVQALAKSSAVIQWPLNQRLMRDSICMSAQLVEQLDAYIACAPQLFERQSELELTAGRNNIFPPMRTAEPRILHGRLRTAVLHSLQAVMRRVSMDIRYDTQLENNVQLLSRAPDAPWCYLFLEHYCFISERPMAIAMDQLWRPHNPDGPALKFFDGYSVYSLHGRLSNPHLIEKSACPMTEPSEARKVQAVNDLCLRQFESQEHFDETCTVKVCEDASGVLYERSDVGNFVRVEDATTTIHGDRKVYVLCVPPEISSAHEAVAWTFQLSVDEYGPKVET